MYYIYVCISCACASLARPYRYTTGRRQLQKNVFLNRYTYIYNEHDSRVIRGEMKNIHRTWRVTFASMAAVEGGGAARGMPLPVPRIFRKTPQRGTVDGRRERRVTTAVSAAGGAR